MSASPTLSQVFALVSKLSDDIGIMADRILIMADKIGDMSDRIVHTEEIMANFATQNTNTNTTQTLLITSNYQTVLDDNETPNFLLNSEASQILVYVSSSITMDTDTVSVLVDSIHDLNQHWSGLKSLAKDNKIYIAVKTIEGNSISSLSNVLTYTTLY